MAITIKLNRLRRRPLLPHSMRWRLPLSYAGIALLATVALGLILLVMLRVYFRANQERYLDTNARAISMRLAPSVAGKDGPELLQAQVEGFAFLLQRRIRLLGNDGRALADSGSPAALAIDLLPRGSGDTAGVSIEVKRQPQPERQPAPAAFGGDMPALPAVPEAPVPLSPPAPPADPSDPLARAEYEARVRQYLAAIKAQQEGYDQQMRAYEASMEAYDRALNARLGLPIGSTLYGFNVNPEVSESSPQSDLVRSAIVIEPQTAQPLGYVELSEGPTYGDEIVQRVAVAWMLATVLATLLAAGIGWLISRRVTAPLRALTDVTTRMAAGELGARAEVRRSDELGALAGAFNQMAGQIEAVVATLRRFVADAAHELNTPITALRANLDLALEDAEPAKPSPFIERVRADVDRLEDLANDLLDLSRVEAAPGHSRHQPIDLCAVGHELGEIYGAQAEQAGVDFRLDLPPAPLMIRGEPNQVRRVIGNLVENAIKFTPAGGAIALSMRPEDRSAPRDALAERFDPSSSVLVEIKDTGIGIPPEDLPHIFSRFHRGRNAAAYAGSGLGLAIVKAVIERHGGDIAVASSPAGTTFSLRWPGVLAEKASGVASLRDKMTR